MGAKDERFRMPKPFHMLKNMDDDSEDIFMQSIHDRYEARPDDLEDMCLADFAAKYNTVSDDASGKNVISLKNNMWKMRLQQKEAVIRTHRYSENDFRYFYSRLLLFLPWRNEDELIGGYSTYEEYYNAKLYAVEENAQKYNMDRIDVEEALENYMANPPEMSEWLAAGVNENDNVEEFLDNDGSSKDMMNEEQDDLQRNKSSLSLKYKAEALKQTIGNEEYRQMMRCLNKEQREIVMQNQKWIKDTILRKKNGLDPEPFLVYLAGAGGCGKSFCIKMMYWDSVHLFHKCNIFRGDGSSLFESTPEDVIALLTAYTGTAAFNIEGTTIHSAFQIGKETLSDKMKTIMITCLMKLMSLTIDEASMVSLRDLNILNNRCAMIKHRDASLQDFGKIAVLAVGDLYQLPSVKAKCIFD